MNIRGLLMIGILLLYGAEVMANDDGCCNCPECGHKVCVAKPVTKTTKKTCYSIEKKDICIPRIRFPWQVRKCGNGACCDQNCDGNGNGCGCAPRCGRVKTVKVLKKKSVECKKCGYEWEIKTVESVPCDSCLSTRRRANCTNCDSSYFKESPKPVKDGKK